MGNIKDATDSPEDWEDFWEDMESSENDDFEKVWKEMDEIEPLTPKKNKMTLSKSVEESLREAEQSLRNALAFAARQERPLVCTEIAEMISKIESVIHTDEILDKLENRKPGDSGMFGNIFDE